MSLVPISDLESGRETQIILISDLLARTAQKPLTLSNMERVNHLARKVLELTTHEPDAA
jgi:hypothetical protein